MKKLFSLALSAMLAASMMANAFAADNEYAYFNDFEGASEGNYASDGVISPVPKQGTIEIAKLDGNTCLKFNHIANETSYDCFADLFPSSSMTAAGLSTTYIIQYDIYFETIAEDMGAYLAMSRETPASGTVFMDVGKFSGAENKVMLTGVEEGVAPFTAGTWYNVAVCFDLDKNLYSVYFDGICLAKDTPYPEDKDGAATVSERIRVGIQGHSGESVMYIDNLKAYNGTVPYDAKTTTPGTIGVTAPTIEGGASAATADIAVVLAAVSAVAASGIIVSKKRK